MAITKVWITEDCTACGLCEDNCPEVFQLGEEVAEVLEVDFSEHEDCIQEAAEDCPSESIKYE
jgi:ferredoxin